MRNEEWYSRLSPMQRKTYALLLAVALLTVPCYCLGAVMLIRAPLATPMPTPRVIRPSPSPTRTPLAPTLSPTPTQVPLPTRTPTATLEPTPTQSFPFPWPELDLTPSPASDDIPVIATDTPAAGWMP